MRNRPRRPGLEMILPDSLLEVVRRLNEPLDPHRKLPKGWNVPDHLRPPIIIPDEEEKPDA
jgi:hypothetical protein